MNRVRTYSELIQLKTFSERFEYLKLNGHIGLETFGADRYLNQRFYSNIIWKKLRHEIIVRDNACDLGIDIYEIPDKEPIYIHHMNPISIEDIVDMNEYVLKLIVGHSIKDVTEKTCNTLWRRSAAFNLQRKEAF